MLSEEIYDLTAGVKTPFEAFGYEYAAIARKHRFKRLFDPLRFLEQQDFLSAYLNEKDPFPRSVEIDLSNACNHDCPFCIYSSLHQKGRRERIPDVKLFDLVEECGLLGVKSILFIGGGEPMIHPQTSLAIQKAHSLGISAGLVTNGSIFRVQDLALVRQYASYVRFSLDAATPETHQIMHRSSDFDKIIDHLSKISQPGRTCTVGVSYFISEENYTEIPQAAWIAKTAGADYIQFKTYSGVKLDATLQLNILNALHDTFPLSDSTFDVHIMERLYQINDTQIRNYHKCHWQNFKTIISASGNVYLCTQKRDKPDAAIGNIYEQSLSDIWKGEQRKSVLRQLQLEKCPFCVHHPQNTLIDFLADQKNTHAHFY